MGLGCAARGLDTARPSAHLETGDLVFLDLDCGDLCDAIEDVTLEQFGVKGPRLSHIGVVEKNASGDLWILEAWPDGGVRETPLSIFLSRVKARENQAGGFYIGRFKPEYRDAAIAATEEMRTFLGAPYDDDFIISNSKFYCSELIADGFLKTQSTFFKWRPMYFGKANSHAYKIWKNYFNRKNSPIPSGKPGLSPLGIYLEGRSKYFETNRSLTNLE